MSNRRSILFLLIGILTLGAVLVLMHFMDEDRRVAARTSLVDPSENVKRLEIRRSGDSTIVLEKREHWRLVQPYAGQADETVVLRLIDALQLEGITEVIAHSELLRLGRTVGDFSLEDPVLSVVVSGDEGCEQVAFGAPTPLADGIYASVSGLDAVFVVPAKTLDAVDLPVNNFRRRSLFLSGAESVVSFDIKNATDSPLSFVRGGESWSVGDKPASSPMVKEFLAQLMSASAAEFVWPIGATNETELVSVSLLAGYGLDPEAAVTITLKNDDGSSSQVSLGKSAGEGTVYALVQDGTAVVTVPSALRNAAVQGASRFMDLRLFPMEGRTVLAFSIVDGGVVYALARDDKKGWRIESPIVAPADSAAVESVLAKILNLSTPDIDPNGVEILLTTNSTSVKVSPDRVFGVGGPLAFRSREMLRIEPDFVKRIVRTFGGRGSRPEVVVYGREQRVWNADGDFSGKTVDNAGVAEVLSAINPLVAERVEKLKVVAEDLDDYGLDVPYLTIAIDQDRDDVVRRNVLIGAKTADGRFATIGSSDAVFVISNEVVDKFSSPLINP